MNKEEAKELVRQIVTKFQSRFKQEVAGENESLETVLRNYEARIARYTWKHAQKWSKWDNDGPVLMPDYARIYYKRGTTEVILQEFPPQVRLMKFRGALTRKNQEENIEDAVKIHNFSLALPYIVFIFKFVNGTFYEVKCAFSDRPLKKLDEQPLRPYLSNIDGNLNVCLGSSLDKSKLIKDQLVQQIAFILDHFWHTSYSDEWSSNFWNNKVHFKDDNRLKDLPSWQAASRDNSLFVIEDVNWVKHSEDCFGDIIAKMVNDDAVSSKLQEELHKELAVEFLSEIKTTVSNNVSAVESKLSDSELDSLADELISKL